MATVEFKFAIGDRVFHTELLISGRVIGLYLQTGQRRSIWVEYADQKRVIHEGWFGEDDFELSPAAIPPPPDTGGLAKKGL